MYSQQQGLSQWALIEEDLSLDISIRLHLTTNTLRVSLEGAFHR